MPINKLRVFLSSTGKDLAAYRQALTDRLTPSDHMSVDGMENFGARDATPLEFCRERVKACDIFVGLVGNYRGWEVEGDKNKRSITEIEFDVATEGGKQRLMYVAPDGFLAATLDAAAKLPREAAALKSRQRKFRTRIMKCCVVRQNYSSPDQLAADIIVDLMNMLAKRIAAQIVAASGTTAAPGATQAVAEAVVAAEKGAAQGDDRLKQALALLQNKKTSEAEALFREVAEEKGARGRRDSKDAAAAYRNLGAIAGLGDPTRALEAYEKAIQFDPDDIESLHWIGHIQKNRGYREIAASRFQRILSMASDDGRAYYRYWARIGIGDICLARSDPDAAMTEYRDASAIADRLAMADPRNTAWQRDRSVSYNKVGGVLVEQGALEEALRSFRDSLAIRERLAQADPENSERQRDLSVSYDWIGRVLDRRGDRSGALKSYRDSLAIRERLAQADRRNAAWQRDLSYSYTKVGDILLKTGSKTEALANFRAGLAIDECLASADPTNVWVRLDLIVSHTRLAENGDEPVRRWPLIVDLLRRLQAEGKLTAEQAKWLPMAERELEAVEKKKKAKRKKAKRT
jgi:tetratricopeptide (TPR) repeat protein